MTRVTSPRDRAAGKSSDLNPLIDRVNSFSADKHWDLGKFLVDKVIPAALKEGIFAEPMLKRMADMPGFKFPFQMLKHCQRFYTYYPDLEKRPLPEEFYFELATKVEDSKLRDRYEKMAVSNTWTISDLQRRIREDEFTRREDERTRFGFDLKQRNVWSFDAPDPRFGKPGFAGRLPGQIVANALYYYTEPGWVVLDPMAGSGTTGDVIERIPFFSDRRCIMYDHEPADERIKRANLLLTGIPEQTATVDYVFVDPPRELYLHGAGAETASAAGESDTMVGLKTILRECARVMKQGGRMTIVTEAGIGNAGVLDFPFEITRLARELGLIHISKVYLPRRGEAVKSRSTGAGGKMTSLVPDCRELLTFEKPRANP